ncbi:pentatricopeptide repeat-containing protein At1g71210, mitochondrial [Populus trichocarpa]|uniref:pentatricopeptide repeat-containing protein At1g71210, mitochondrial n=1 Tax=Populus trichocarpa TaxID=3694 RepID=UPI002279628C|nr:pentatricopeptide repeat-containing protein At1g71210, mitochondrial [Populus trichocarpa]
MNTILDLLEAYKWTRDLNVHRNVTFRTFMVIGYAVAGKPDVALQLLARTCFQGHDADAFSYHVLLNSLIEHSFLEAFEVVYKLISSRGFGNAVTRFLKVKYLCKEKLLDEGKGNYCRSGDRFGYAQALSFLVDGFCQNVSLVKAGKLIEEISELGVVPMEPGCGIWLTNLVQARDIDAAFPVPEEQGSLEGCVPDVYQCNFLLFRLLKDNRLEDVYDLLIEMKENQLSTNTFLHECCILLLLQSWNEIHFFKLLEMQLPRHETNSMVYNSFIDGDGHGKKPELAREVFEMMQRNGIKPNVCSHALTLKAYLRNERISDALNFFKAMHDSKMDSKEMVPSMECYDAVVQLLCSTKKHDIVLYEAWVRSRNVHNETSSDLPNPGLLNGAFSGHLEVSAEYLEEDMKPIDGLLAILSMEEKIRPGGLWVEDMRRSEGKDVAVSEGWDFHSQSACALIDDIQHPGSENFGTLLWQGFDVVDPD